MAERFEDPPAPAGSQPTWRHGWFSYQDYLSILDSQIAGLRSRSLIEVESIDTNEAIDADGELRSAVVRGRLRCTGGVTLEFHEAFLVRRGQSNRYEILGIDLSYHAWLAGDAIRDLMRYDDSHGPLHRHLFDKNGEETGRISCSLDELPSLTDLVERAIELAEAP